MAGSCLRRKEHLAHRHRRAQIAAEAVFGLRRPARLVSLEAHFHYGRIYQ